MPNNRFMEQTTYGKRLHEAAREDFRRFWSSYRYFVTFIAVFLSPAILQIFRHGFRSIINLRETLVNGLVGFVLSIIGTYAIAIWRGAEALDSGLQKDISKHKHSLAEMQESLNDAARIAAERRLVKPSLSLASGSRQSPISLMMRWSQGGGEGSGPVSVTPVTLTMENEGESTIKVLAFRLFRSSSKSYRRPSRSRRRFTKGKPVVGG